MSGEMVTLENGKICILDYCGEFGLSACRPFYDKFCPCDFQRFIIQVNVLNLHKLDNFMHNQESTFILAKYDY